MNPLMIALIGSGLLGGLLGGHGRKPIDPNELRRLFGPDALAGDTRSLFALLSSSPEFMSLMNSASTQGSAAGQRVRAGLARAGIDASGVGAISGAVSHDFGRTLQLNALAGLWQRALAEAGPNLAARMGLYGNSRLAYQNTPTMAQSFGNALTGGASLGLTALANRTPASPNTSLGALGYPVPGPWGPGTGGTTEANFALPRPVVGSGGSILRKRPGEPF